LSKEILRGKLSGDFNARKKTKSFLMIPQTFLPFQTVQSSKNLFSCLEITFWLILWQSGFNSSPTPQFAYLRIRDDQIDQLIYLPN